MRSKGGTFIFGIGIAALGILSLAFMRLVDGLQPALSSQANDNVLAIINGLGLVASGFALFWERWRAYGALAIMAIFGLSLVLLQLPKLLATGFQLISLVAPMEVALIVCAASTVIWPETRLLASRFSGAVLLLFGAIHFSERTFIAAMIPEWMPGRPVLPIATGTAMILAGLALVTDRWARYAAATIAATFLSWLPLVHVGRILRDPASAFEWAFAATAVVLAGCLLIVGEACKRDTQEAQVLSEI